MLSEKVKGVVLGVVLMAVVVGGGLAAKSLLDPETASESEAAWWNIWAQYDLAPAATAETPVESTGATVADPAALDTVPPSLQIIDPADGTSYGADTSSITVALAASDDSGSVELVVQNLDTAGAARKTYAVGADKKVTDFQLYSGWNAILALARDSSGNVTTSFILVERLEGNNDTPAAPAPVGRPSETPAEPAAATRRWRDGVYTGTGYYGWGENRFPLTAELTIANDKIVSLKYLEFPTSDLVKDESFLDPMKNALLAEQDISAVDTITGATGTSDAFIAAVTAALAKAK